MNLGLDDLKKIAAHCKSIAVTLSVDFDCVVDALANEQLISNVDADLINELMGD